MVVTPSDAAPVEDAGAEVVIVGGGPAGLSAALVLGRARRRVVVIDAGQPRNAPSPGVHSFFSRDGILPADLLRLGREQLLPYGTVELRPARVTGAERAAAGFRIILDGGDTLPAKTLVLATGVADGLPAIEGLPERWGRSVFHCPYCHGWEVRDQPLAVLGRGAEALHLAPLLRGWTADLVLCSNGPADLGEADRLWLRRAGIAVREEPVRRLEGEGDSVERIILDGGEVLARRALFLRPAVRQRSELPAALGCALTETGLVKTDEDGRTTVPGVFAVGDCATRVQQVAVAVAMGARAAIALNNELAMAAA